MRFESSVFGNHAMLPPPEVAQNMQSTEKPSAYPSGADTSFQNPTPMPHRFTSDAVPTFNKRFEKAKEVNPCYHTTAGEIGQLSIAPTDLPMRWYGRQGLFTGSWVAEPKTKVNSGLNTGMDRSNAHHKCACNPPPPPPPLAPVDPLAARHPGPHGSVSEALAWRSRPACATVRPSRTRLSVPSRIGTIDTRSSVAAAAATTRAGPATSASPTPTWPTWAPPRWWSSRHDPSDSRAARPQARARGKACSRAPSRISSRTRDGCSLTAAPRPESGLFVTSEE